MSDFDVQDVRELVAKQKADGERKQRAMGRNKGFFDRPFQDSDVHIFSYLDDYASRDKRLGIQKGTTSSTTS